MTAKKGCLLAVAAGVVLLAMIVSLVFWLTGGAVDSAERFLAQLASGDIEVAYESTAAQFRAQTSPDEFSNFVQQLGLNRFESASWTTRSVENDQANLEGSIRTADGGTVPLKMTLVREGGEWRILSISGPSAGVSSTPAARPQPSDDELRELASRTLIDFAAAIDAGGDFADFHESISNLWKSQITVDGLRSAFQALIDQAVDLGSAGGEPVFTESPGIDDNGIVLLRGYVVSADSPSLNYELKYIYEHPEWKLFGIRVTVSQSEQAPNQNPDPAPDQPAGDAPESPVPSGEGAFVIEENPELRGRLGRLVAGFPAGSQTSGTKIEAFRAGEDVPAVTSYGSIQADLLPGRYDVTVSGHRISEVEIASTRNTRLLVGVLRVQAGSGTKIVVHAPTSEGGWKPVATAYGASDFGLLIGDYGVEIAGQIESVTISAGTITEF